MKNKNVLDNFFKLSIIVGTVIISLSVAYYFVVYLPQRETRKIELEKQEQGQKLEKLEECIEGITSKSKELWTKWCLLEGKEEDCSMNKVRYDERVKFEKNEQEKCYLLYK